MTFAFLADQDRDLCRALEVSTERNYRGYRETTYYFDDLRAARALIGHPRVFPGGDRENPFEIVEQQPKLVVVQEGDGRITLSLDPGPRRGDDEFRVIADGLDVTYEQILDNLQTRDGNDQCQWAPLLVPGNAIRVDTTHINIQQVVELIIEHIGVLMGSERE